MKIPATEAAARAEPETEELNWLLAGHAAVVMAPAPVESDEIRNPPGTV